MLKIDNISVCLKENNKEILNNINISINDNTTHVLMGPNGAGKSSLVKAIMHHPSYQIQDGKVYYNDIDITNADTSNIAKNGIYYISQTPVKNIYLLYH